LKVQAILADVFLSGRKIPHVHHEGDLSSLFRGQPFKMGDLVVIKGGEFFRAFDGHDVGDAVEVCDGLVRAGEQAAAFERRQLARMRDDLIQDVLRNR
jgi:hypothetical protein